MSNIILPSRNGKTTEEFTKSDFKNDILAEKIKSTFLNSEGTLRFPMLIIDLSNLIDVSVGLLDMLKRFIYTDNDIEELEKARVLKSKRVEEQGKEQGEPAESDIEKGEETAESGIEKGEEPAVSETESSADSVAESADSKTTGTETTSEPALQAVKVTEQEKYVSTYFISVDSKLVYIGKVTERVAYKVLPDFIRDVFSENANLYLSEDGTRVSNIKNTAYARVKLTFEE